MLANHISYRELPCSCKECMNQNYDACMSESYWRTVDLTPKPNSKPRRIDNDDSDIDSDDEQIENIDILCCCGCGLDASTSGYYGNLVTPHHRVLPSCYLHGFINPELNTEGPCLGCFKLVVSLHGFL